MFDIQGGGLRADAEVLLDRGNWLQSECDQGGAENQRQGKTSFHIDLSGNVV